MLTSRYASLEEAWKVPAMYHIDNPYKYNKNVQKTILHTERKPQTPCHHKIKAILSRAYARRGWAGLRQYLEPGIAFDLEKRMEMAAQPPSILDMFTMDGEDALLVVILIFAIIVALK